MIEPAVLQSADEEILVQPKEAETLPAFELVEVREAHGKGRGVFATAGLAAGEVVIVGRPLAGLEERTWQSLQVDIDTHIRIDEPFERVNHSCDPNCGTRSNRFGGYDLVARRRIGAGEEITFDYCMTEWECVGFQECDCQSEHCRGVVRGAKYLPGSLLRQYSEFLAPYIRALVTSSVR